MQEGSSHLGQDGREAHERAERLQERSAALATPTDEASRLKDWTARNDAVQGGLRKAVEAIITAAGQLYSVSRNDHEGLSAAIQAFNQAMGQLHRLSGAQLQLAAERINLERGEQHVVVSDRDLRPAPGAGFAERVNQAVKATSKPEDQAVREARSVLRSQRPAADNVQVIATSDMRSSQQSRSVRAGRGRTPRERTQRDGPAGRFDGR